MPSPPDLRPAVEPRGGAAQKEAGTRASRQRAALFAGAPRDRLRWLAVPFFCWGCAAPHSPQVALPVVRSTLPKPQPVVASPDLNADEQIILEGLRTHSERLTAIGERNPSKSWELADAADYLASTLEGLGYGVERQGYEVEDVDLQNLSVTIPGTRDVGQVLVVGTHYDSKQGSRGGQTALATAALLELARMMKGAQLTKTLELAFFSLGESPHGDGAARGARHYARKLAAEVSAGAPPGTPEPLRSSAKGETLGLIHLGDFSNFSSPKASDRGEVLVRMTVTSGGNDLAKSLEPALFGEPLRVRPTFVSTTMEESDGLAFFEQGIPVVSFFGGETPIASGDSPQTPQTKQLEAAARVVQRLRAGIGEILGEKPDSEAPLRHSSAVSRAQMTQ